MTGYKKKKNRKEKGSGRKSNSTLFLFLSFGGEKNDEENMEAGNRN